MAEKQVLYVSDSNGNSYNGQIRLDTRILSSQDLWNDYSEGHLELPYQITYKSSADATGAGVVNGFMLGLKCGYHQLTDQIQVSLNGTSVVQQTPFSNLHMSYRMMTTWSDDDLSKHGYFCGFYPDSSGSHSFSGAASRNGGGMSNNVVALPSANGLHVWSLGAAANGSLRATNSGLLQRLELTSFPATSNDQGYGGLATINTSGFASSVGKNYVSDNGQGGLNRIWTWNILACIRLKDLADFFDKMPITKGSWITMTVSYNSSSFEVTSAAAPNPTMILNGQPTINTGRTNPVMVSSANVNNPCVSLVNGANSVSCSVGGAYASLGARIYVPSYRIKPGYEAQLLKRNPVKKFKYCDIINYNITGVLTTTSFRQIITNSIKNPRAVVVIPQVNPASNSDGNININPLHSPFDSSPHTTCPMGAINNFNVQLNGKNVFQENYYYDFEAFRNELSQINCIDGGSTVGCANGLIGYKEWDNAYRYYVANLLRQSSLTPGSSMSVVVQGTNNTDSTMDYYVFVEHEKEAAIELITGRLVSLDD
jgi:hypothetical protein